DSHLLFFILYSSYLHDIEGGRELLYKLLTNNRYYYVWAINDIIKYYYTVPDSQEKNNELLAYILKNTVEEDFEELHWSFRKDMEVRLDDIYNFLKDYVSSPYFKLTEYFIEYLIKECGRFPFQAIELFNLSVISGISKDSAGVMYHVDEATIKFVVGAFDALKDNDERSKTTRLEL